jgi:hypothetical protein
VAIQFPAISPVPLSNGDRSETRCDAPGRSPKLAKLLIYSLMSDAFWEKAAAFLTRNLAEISTPYLEEAAQSDRSPRVRARAAQILASRAARP